MNPQTMVISYARTPASRWIIKCLRSGEQRLRGPSQHCIHLVLAVKGIVLCEHPIDRQKEILLSLYHNELILVNSIDDKLNNHDDNTHRSKMHRTNREDAKP